MRQAFFALVLARRVLALGHLNSALKVLPMLQPGEPVQCLKACFRPGEWPYLGLSLVEGQLPAIGPKDRLMKNKPH